MICPFLRDDTYSILCSEVHDQTAKMLSRLNTYSNDPQCATFQCESAVQAHVTSQLQETHEHFIERTA